MSKKSLISIKIMLR